MGLPSSSVPLIQSEDSPESKDDPSGPSSKLAQHQLLEGIRTERRDSITSVGEIQCKQKVNYISDFPTSASFLSVLFVN